MCRRLADLNPEELSDIQKLLQRAELGDRSALTDLVKTLDDYPEISKRYGDLGAHAIESWLQLIAGPNLMLRETISRKLDDMRGELNGGEHTPLLVKLVVEQVLASWLQARHVDALIAQATSQSTPSQLEKRQAGAHGRLLRSIQSLASLRKVLRERPTSIKLAADTDRETLSLPAVGDKVAV